MNHFIAVTLNEKSVTCHLVDLLNYEEEKRQYCVTLAGRQNNNKYVKASITQWKLFYFLLLRITRFRGCMCFFFLYFLLGHRRSNFDDRLLQLLRTKFSVVFCKGLPPTQWCHKTSWICKKVIRLPITLYQAK